MKEPFPHTEKGLAMKRKLLLFYLLTSAFGLRALGQQYSIDWFKVAGGGGTSTGATYQVTGTIGQPDASGAISGGNYSVTGGFWALYPVQTSGAPPLTIQQTTTNTIVISWPNTAGTWVLQESPTGASGSWTNVSAPEALVADTIQVILPASEIDNQFQLVAGPTTLQLSITRGAGSTVIISWAAPAPGWTLQESPTLAAGSWDEVSTAPVQVADQMQVTLTMSSGGMFYRLSQLSATPQLVIASGATNSVVISWPASFAPAWVLQENSTLATDTWTNSAATPVQVSSNLQITVSPTVGSKFYRLKN
jgi:hypothetical protein